MKIMVFDVPAVSGGAISILNSFYEKYKANKDNHYYFILSTPFLQETENTTILNYPWVKKSWIHRLYFDNAVAPKLVKKYNVDEVFSLQNIAIPQVKAPQTIYLQNALFFSDYKFSIFTDIKLWVYKKLLRSLL